MAQNELLCWNCGKLTGVTGKVFRADGCQHCNFDLRCCRGCLHFDPTRRFACKESIDTPETNKEKSNMCDFFQVRDARKIPGGRSSTTDSKDNAKSSFDDLFKD
jgi:hypothetical protein